MHSTWKPLPLSRKQKGIPPLLVKHEFGPSDYRVWLTDLSYIWTESLDRRQITRRALNTDTSIDPSEDAAQLLLFLSSIADALRQRPGTDVILDESNDYKQLTLKTSTPLPQPLQPLEWSIMLILAPQSVFVSEFVSPLLSQQLTAKVEKTSLLQQLKEQDNVISKLIEKLQGDGVDLGKMFHGAVSSKSGAGPTARGAVAKSVIGLREFDRDRWESQLAKEIGISGDLSSLLPRIFDNDEKAAGERLQLTDHGEWWKSVGRKNSQREEATTTFVETDDREGSLPEDEFQRQSTPAKLPVQTTRYDEPISDTEANIPSNIGKDEGGSTTDESDDNLESSHFKPLPSRREQASARSHTNNTERMNLELMDLNDDGLTASASDVEKSPAKTHLVPKSKYKLGKIGGKGRDSSPEIPAIPTSKSKLGKIGGKGTLGKVGGTSSVSSRNENIVSNKQQYAVSPKEEARDRIADSKSIEPEGRGRTDQQRPEPSPPRETSQERANRKRAQLKRELENKSQTAVKKKRRF